MNLPVVHLKKSKEADVRAGNPWVFAGDVVESSALLLIDKGELVELRSLKHQFLAIGYYNRDAGLCCRILTLKNEPITETFFEARIKRAITRRGELAQTRYLRLVHSEADNLAGLVIDQFGDVLSIQLGTAGMVRLWPMIEAAITNTIAPKGMVVHPPSTQHEIVAANV